MNLEALLKRAEEIEAAIVNMAHQLNILQGHKGETQHWIKQLQDESQTKVVEPVAPAEELPVE